MILGSLLEGLIDHSAVEPVQQVNLYQALATLQTKGFPTSRLAQV
jgi:hypothetical protein